MAIPYSRFIVGPITWYSVLIISGVLLALVLGKREETRLGLPKETMLDIVLIAVPSGVIGSRILLCTHDAGRIYCRSDFHSFTSGKVE